MPPLPSRKELESMKRADLQRICKDYGVKANLKSEALIDLLLDTQSAPTPHHPPPPQPHPPEPASRSVSIRQHSIPKAGPSRTTSMIIHEPDEENVDCDQSPVNDFKEPSPSLPPIVPPPRTRKAKDLQTRLGVGKPVAAGGSGPRAITRSSGSNSRGKRAKSSRSLKPREAPIQEEHEPTHPTTPEPDHLPITGGEKEQSPPRLQTQRDLTPKFDAILSVEEINRIIARAVQPLHDEIQSLKSELQKVQANESQAKELKQRLVELNDTHKKVKHDLDNVKNIAAGIQTMKEEIQQLRDDIDDQADFRPSTPRPTGQKTQSSLGLGVPSAFRLGQPLIEVGKDPVHDTKTTTTLGKRSRDVTLASQKPTEPIHPTAKRPRIEKDKDLNDSDEDNENEEVSVKPSFPAFAVYSGAEETDEPPPPTTLLPHTFASESAGPSDQGPRASSSHGIENQTRPFNFAFQPITSTPNAFASTFPYPEPPQSPSPAGVGQGGFMGHQSGRTDVFKQFGLPSPSRPSRLYGALPVAEDRDEFINPAALSQPDSGNSRDRRTSGDIGSGSSKQRTMYGTELEGDTRFGDFGLEGGVAGGFWPNARF